MSYNSVTDEEVAKVLEKHPKNWNEEEAEIFVCANKEDAHRLGEALAKSGYLKQCMEADRHNDKSN